MQINGFSEVGPVLPVDLATEELRSGDILFCCGHALFSRLVRRITKSEISHVGMLYCCKQSRRMMLIHSMDFIGVKPLPLKDYAETYDNGRGYNGMLVVGRHEKLQQMPAGDVQRLIEIALSKVGRPYNKEAVLVRAIQEFLESIEHRLSGNLLLAMVVANFARVAIGMPIGFGKRAIWELKRQLECRVNDAARNEALACSELVDACFREIGMVFSRSEQEVIPAPSQIAEDPNIRVVCRLMTRAGPKAGSWRGAIRQ